MNTFTVLADPTRRRIIEALCLGERPFGEIAEQFEMSRPAVSQHLKVLREAGLVSVRADAQRRIYRLEQPGFDEIEQWLIKIRSYWNPRLDRLERALRKEEQGK